MMNYSSISTKVFPSFLIGLTLCLGIQAAAQTTLEFDARLDAATVIQSFEGENFKYNGASTGLRVSFSLTSVNQVSKNTSLLYGLSYASSGFNRENVYWCGNSFDRLTPEELTEVDENMNYNTEKVEHISLPIGLRQVLKQGKKWTIYGQAILEPMAYVRTVYANPLWEPNRGTTIEEDDLAQPLQLAAGLGAGFERKISDAWTLAFRPTFRMHLTKAAKDSDNIVGNARHLTTGVAFVLGHSF